MAQEMAPEIRRYACDVHTHTLYSRHAYSTVEENVRAASEQGIELLGIADHFSDMLFETRDIRNFQHFVNFRIWPRDWHGVRLLRACEADIVDLQGHLYGWDTVYEEVFTGDPFAQPMTLKDFVFRACDYVVASVHGKVWAKGASAAQGTQMYVSALQDPKVAIVGHPGRAGVPFEPKALAEAAHDLHKMIEINEHSFYSRGPEVRGLCRRVAECCAEAGTRIAVSTDAHISYELGKFERVPAMLDEIDFPPELIATRSAIAFQSALAEAGLPVEG